MRIERFDPAADVAARSALYEVYAAGAPVDDPAGPAMSPAAFGGYLGHGWSGEAREAWLVTGRPAGPGRPGDAGTSVAGASAAGPALAGGYLLELPERENKEAGSLAIWIHPELRRAGLGRALLRHAAGRASAAGRSVLTGDTRDGSPGDGFARALGAAPGLPEIRRVLDVAALPPGHLARLRAEAGAAAAGYSLLDWKGPAPEQYLSQVAAINDALADAPRAAGEEAQRWDARRVREAGQRVAAQGLRSYCVAAHEDRSGTLAGLTEVGVDPAVPAWGHQELTAVARAHRGHRLGLLLKVAMLGLLARQEPQVTRIVTWNAAANRHMIAINEALGYRVLDGWTSWRLPVAALA